MYTKDPFSSTQNLFSDYKTGFGGKFGVQKDRVDKSAVKTYEETGEKVGTNYEKTRPDGKILVIRIGNLIPCKAPSLNFNLYSMSSLLVPSKNASNLRARFENIAQQNEIDAQKRAEDEKRKREEKDKKDKLDNKKREEQRIAQEKEIRDDRSWKKS